MKYKEIKEEVYEANLLLPQNKLVLYTFGNVSIINRQLGVVGIKPSGISYDEMKIDDIVVLDLDGSIIEGELNPSSDTKTHLILYKSFENITSIVHTHSTYATAWAQARKSIPVLGTTHADHLPICVPITEIISKEATEKDYEEETGKQILKAFEKIDYEKTPMVLVAGHGPFTWGTSAEKAVYNSVILEELGKMAFITKSINPTVEPLNDYIINKHFERKHGKNAYYGQAKK